MIDPPLSSRERFAAALRGNPEGTFRQRLLYYASRTLAGAIAGFMVVAMATSSREGAHHSFDLALYLGAIAAGAVLALMIVAVPRLLRPKDWPTHEEFRRGGHRPSDEGERK